MLKDLKETERETARLRQETEALKQENARNVHPWHILGYECPVEYDHEAFRGALKAHLKAIKEEALSADQQVGRFLLEEVDNIVKQLVKEYMWFRFLREKIGIAVTEPTEFRATSLLAPASVRDARREQYHNSFYSWIAELNETDPQSETYYVGMKGMLMIQPAMLVVPWDERPRFSIRCLAMPEMVEFKSFVGENLINVCERAHDYLPTLVGYARSGYAPVVSLPVVLTPQGNEGVIYWPERGKIYYFDPEVDEEVA